MKNGLKLFSGSSNPGLAEKIADYLDLQLGEVDIISYPDGEKRVLFADNLRGMDVFIIQPTCPPVNESYMELFIMLDAARRASPNNIVTVMPYMGYARQDRKDQPRVSITSKLMANLWSSATGPNSRIMLMDLHAQQIQGFFDTPLDHLYSSPVFISYLKRKKYITDHDVVVVSPDSGAVKTATAYADQLNGADVAVVIKRRVSGNETQTFGLIGDVENKDCLIIDDITSTVGTLDNAASVLHSKGAKSITAIIAHCLINDEGLEKLKGSKIERLLTTDTVPNLIVKKETEMIKVLSVSELLAEAIRRVYHNESISSLLHYKSTRF